MALAITVTKTPKFTGNTLKLFGSIVASGTYAAGGDVLNFLTATYPPGQTPPPVTGLPLVVYIQSAKAGGLSGFQYGFNPGTTQANGKMQVFTGAAAQAALTELSNGAYPAGVTGDTITFEAEFEHV